MQSRPIIRKGKPEEIVNDSLRSFFKANGFVMQRVESKAVYSQRLKRYQYGMAERGTSDWLGCAPTGRACFVEAKVKVTPSCFKPGQRDYLITRIRSNAFACVVDSAERCADLYETFVNLPVNERQAYLLSQIPDLPKRRPRRPNPE